MKVDHNGVIVHCIQQTSGDHQQDDRIVLGHFVQLNNYDAVFCAGDDETDESMFRYFGDAEVFSIKVGSGADTLARFRMSGPKASRAFLSDMLDNV